jgi:hypothetical protein
MASKKPANLFTLPTREEHANAVLGMWKLGVPEEHVLEIDPTMRVPCYNAPQDCHDRQRAASAQYVHQ